VCLCCKHGFPGLHGIISGMVSDRSCRLKAPKGFNMVQVGVQREPRNQVQKRNNQERAAEKTMKKSLLGRVARTIPVQRARQAACPLPVVDDRKFAARAPPLRSCRSCRGAFFCECRADGAQLAAKGSHATMVARRATWSRYIGPAWCERLKHFL
jgi:hypothetical protein